MTDGAARSRGARLVTFALILAGLFATAYALGERLPGHEHSETSGDDHSAHSGMDMSATMHPASATDGMYELEQVGTDGLTHRFRIVHHGGAVLDYELAHGAVLHVVYVRSDLSDFHHVHPDIGDDGTFAVELPARGPWHIAFECTPSMNDGAAIVVSADIADPEVTVDTTPLPAAATESRTPTAGGDEIVATLTIDPSGLRFLITRADGRPVDGLEPYLGQSAHLVALRQSDLAYAHLHPTSAIGDPVITFEGELPTGATYRAFLQFGWAGEVLTLPFTIET